MCGIWAVLSPDEGGSPIVGNACEIGVTDFEASLKARGPDNFGEVEVPLRGWGKLTMAMALLQLRGHTPVSVPLSLPGGDQLCFNGEIFGGLDLLPDENDGARLAEALHEVEDVPAVLNQLRGPWSIVYWQQRTSTLWFGRDFMGRRSLLVHYPTSPSDPFILTSVASPAASKKLMDQAKHSDEGAAASVAAECPREFGADGEEESGGALPPSPWKELPPGVYSLTLTPGAIGAQWTNSMSDIQSHIVAHPWRDDAIIRLWQYERSSLQATHDNYVSDAGPEYCSVAEMDASSEAARKLPKAASSGINNVLRALFVAVETRCRLIAVNPRESDHASCDSRSSLVTPTQRPATIDGQPAASTEDGSTECTSSCSNYTKLDENLQGAESSHAPAPLMILFSGGVDSTLLAALAHAALPPGVPIELANVCFDGGRSPDRLAAHDALEELAAYAPDREWQLIEVDASLADVDRNRLHILSLLEPAGTVMDLNIGAALWLAVSGRGILRKPKRHTAAEAQKTNGCTAGSSIPGCSAAIVDSLTQKCQTDQKIKNGFAGASIAGHPPDLDVLTQERTIDCNTKLSSSSLIKSKEMACSSHSPPAPNGNSRQGVCSSSIPSNQSKLVEDEQARGRTASDKLPYDAASLHQEPQVAGLQVDKGQGAQRIASPNYTNAASSQLCQSKAVKGCEPHMYRVHANEGQDIQSILSPSGTSTTSSQLRESEAQNSKLSLNEGGTQRVASSRCASTASSQLYESKARVVLLGHGADEQCGGYGRHRTRFREGGVEALAKELQTDVCRMWLRNLGRDDRLVSDWGREARHPFLDEAFMEAVLQLKMEEVTDLTLPPGEGDKRVLRALLHTLGLPRAARRVKRAIQFGSRIGKLSNCRDFGSNRAANKHSAGSCSLTSLPQSKHAQESRES